MAIPDTTQDSVPTDPEAVAQFWAGVIDYGFYTHSPDTPWEDVERQAAIHGREISRDDLGWGTEPFRFMVLPAPHPFRVLPGGRV